MEMEAELPVGDMLSTTSSTSASAETSAVISSAVISSAPPSPPAAEDNGSGSGNAATTTTAEEGEEEPSAKKPRLLPTSSSTPQPLKKAQKLESRLNIVLCCTVCLDLPWNAVYQCTNGHLMCSGCFAHLLADARLKNESGTCPNCRCEISKLQCSRNLAVEKAVAELPCECQFCNEHFPRNSLERHSKECSERCVPCKFLRIGCTWLGPFHELTTHESECPHPRKSGSDVMEALVKMDSKDGEGKKVFENLLDLLSFEKINFQDLQLRPYRTDDFITRLYYETSRFSALQNQWVVKARVNDNQKDPSLTATRYISYQLCLKSKITTPLEVQFVVLCGPYGEFKLQTPSIYRFTFDAETSETEYCTLHLPTSTECNKLLSAKTINFRLIIFQVQK